MLTLVWEPRFPRPRGQPGLGRGAPFSLGKGRQPLEHHCIEFTWHGMEVEGAGQSVLSKC